MSALVERILMKTRSVVSHRRRLKVESVREETGPVVLSERDSLRVAELLNNPPELTKGLRKAIEAKYG